LDPPDPTTSSKLQKLPHDGHFHNFIGDPYSHVLQRYIDNTYIFASKCQKNKNLKNHQVGLLLDGLLVDR
jgi:hypothetical protein